MKDIGKQIIIEGQSLKGSTPSVLHTLKISNYIFFLVVMMISLLACVPNAKTQAGQNVLNRAGSFITLHNQTFFLIILLLCLLEGISLALQFYMEQKTAIRNISAIKSEMTSAFNESKDNDKEMVNKVHCIEIEFLTAGQLSLRTIDTNHNKLLITLMGMKGAYKDNLRDYYDNKRNVYTVIRSTQLNQIKEINDLIDTYCKL